MRRIVLPILFAVVLATPLVLGRLYGTVGSNGTGGSGAGAGAGAPRDALQLIIITPHVESIRREFADGFSRWHQQQFGRPVFVDYRVIGGTNEVVRFFETSKPTLFEKQGTFGIDLVW